MSDFAHRDFRSVIALVTLEQNQDCLHTLLWSLLLLSRMLRC